jgi:imidazolonepropionase-like amidohydrolase
MADSTLFRDLTVFDGQALAQHRSVLIENGQIVDADFHGEPPAGAKLVHCEPCTLMPGLIDSHVHAYRDEELPLLFGVTTELDMFMDLKQAAPVKQRMREGRNQGAADLFTAGTLVTVAGGHGTEYGMPIPTLSRPEEADAFIRARVAEGSDYIKLVYDSGEGWGGKIPTLDLATLKAAITAAHAQGKKAVVHVQDLEHGRQAIAAGADGLAHLFTDHPADAAFVKLAAEHHAFVVPTYTVMESFAGRNAAADLGGSAQFGDLLMPGQASSLKQGVARMDVSARVDMAMHDSLAALKAAGVPILAGTDAGNPGVLRGISLHRELALLVKGGLSPLEALRTATSAPADAFGLADRGRIAKGRKADLLLVEGDPTTHIEDSRRIIDVWKDGQSSAALRTQRLAAVQSARQQAAAQTGVKLPADGRIGLFSAAGEGQPAKLAAPFGGWMPTTDQFMAGKSAVLLASNEGGVSVAGSLRAGFSFPWAGLMYYPGAKPFEPTDLSSAKALHFKARGDGGSYQLQAFWSEGGQMPTSRSFTAGKDWQDIEVPFDALGGFNPHTTLALNFVATGQARDFRFEIADVKLVAR